MKKIVLIILALFLIPLLTVKLQAQESEADSPEQAWLEEDVIYTPKLLPGNPFYFLKKWKERLELGFAITSEKKAAKRIEIATRRLAEVKVLSEKDSELAQQWLEQYQEELEKLSQEMEQLPEGKVDWLLEHVGQMTLKHQAVLLRVYEKAPESAKKGLENALEKSLKGHQQAVESISRENQNQAAEKIQKEQEKILRFMERFEEKIEAGTGERKGVLNQIREQLEIQVQEQNQGQEQEPVETQTQNQGRNRENQD